MDTLRKMELVETKKQGIFVMPLERITILSSYVKLLETEGESNYSVFIVCWKIGVLISH